MPNRRLLARPSQPRTGGRLGLLLTLVLVGATAAVASASTGPTTSWVRTSTAAGSGYTDTKAYSVSARADGTAVVGGYFDGSNVDLGDGTLRTSAGSGNDNTAFVTGLGSDGSVRWVRTSSTSNNYSDTTTYGVSALADGTAIAGGAFLGSATDFGDGVPRDSSRLGNDFSLFVMGLTASGSVRWVTTSSSPGSASTSVKVEDVSARADGTSVAAGSVYGASVDFGDGTVRASPRGGTSIGAFAMGLGADGAVRWVRVPTATSASNSVAYGVSARADGTAVVCGRFTGGPIDFGDGRPRTSADGGVDETAFIQGLAADGSVQWVRTSTAPTGAYSSVVATGVSAIADGTAVVTGMFTGTGIDFGDGVPRTSANGGAGGSIFVMGLSATGTVRWVRTSTSASGNGALASSVSAIADGSSVVTGWFDGTVDFGDGTPRSSAVGGSAFTEGLDASGAVRWVRISSGGTGSPPDPQSASALPDGTALITGFFNGSGVDFGDGRTGTSAAGGSSYSSFVQQFVGIPLSSPTSATSTGTGEAATAAAFRPRTRCVAATCTTTGAVPASTTRITQVATRGGSRAAATCRIIGKGSTRTFSCRVKLSAGRWAFTTRAKAGQTVLVTAVTRGTVKATPSPTPTGVPTPVTG